MICEWDDPQKKTATNDSPVLDLVWIPSTPLSLSLFIRSWKIQEKKHTKPPSHGHPWLHNESVAVQLCPALQMKVGKFKALWRRLHPTMAHRSSSNGDLQHVTNRRSFDPAPNIGRFFIMFNPSVAAENHVSSTYGIDLVISLAGNYPILGALDVPKSDAFPHFPSKK